jgi:Tol biopolymer transport system component
MKRALVWVAPLLLLGLGAAPARALEAASPAPAAVALPANGRILFTHCGDAGGCQIYTANPDGTAIVQVTHGAGSVAGDWSPDGKRIAYLGFTSGDAAIWIVDADGTHPRQLTPNDPASDNQSPRFTPDGKWILFTNCLGADCDGGISAVRPDGTGMHHVTANSHNSYNVADQAPGGSRMTYMRWHVDGVKMAVYVSDARGRHERRITPPGLEAWAPDWSPTGRRIAFASNVFWDRPAPSLFTVRPDGSGLAALTHPTFPHSDAWPAYSPDGTKVVFESDRGYADFCCDDLYVVSASGGTPHRVPLPFDAYEPRWGAAPIQPATALATAATLRTIAGPPCANVNRLAALAVCQRPRGCWHAAHS